MPRPNRREKLKKIVEEKQVIKTERLTKSDKELEFLVDFINSEFVIEDAKEAGIKFEKKDTFAFEQYWNKRINGKDNFRPEMIAKLLNYAGACQKRKQHKAAIWSLEIAVNLGSKKAIEDIYAGGFLLTRPGATPEEKKEGVTWLELAANKNHINAVWLLGQLYYEGSGVVKDEEKALSFYARVAEQGNEEIQEFLAELYYYKGNLQEAEVWFKKLADRKNERAMCFLAGFYYDGQINIKQKYKVAMKYAKEAANERNPAMARLVSKMYDLGQGVVKDPIAALHWLQKAAVWGHAYSALKLGEHFCIHQNYSESAKWLQHAYKKGERISAFLLGIFYFSGQGLPQDRREAAKYFRCAVAEGYPKAFLYLRYIAKENGNAELIADLAFIMANFSENLDDTTTGEVLDFSLEDAVMTRNLAERRLYQILGQIAQARIFFGTNKSLKNKDQHLKELEKIFDKLELQFGLIVQCERGEVPWSTLQSNVQNIERLLTPITQERREFIRNKSIKPEVKESKVAVEEESSPAAAIETSAVAPVLDEEEEITDTDEVEEDKSITAIQLELTTLQATINASSEAREVAGGCSAYSLTNQYLAQLGVMARLMRRIQVLPKEHLLFDTDRKAQHISNLLYHDHRFYLLLDQIVDKQASVTSVEQVEEASQALIKRLNGVIETDTADHRGYLTTIKAPFFKDMLAQEMDRTDCEAQLIHARRILCLGNRKGAKVLVDEKLLYACAVLEAAYTQIKHERPTSYKNRNLEDQHEAIKSLAQQIRHPDIITTPDFLAKELQRQRKKIRASIAQETFSFDNFQPSRKRIEMAGLSLSSPTVTLVPAVLPTATVSAAALHASMAKKVFSPSAGATATSSSSRGAETSARARPDFFRNGPTSAVCDGKSEKITTAP